MLLSLDPSSTCCGYALLGPHAELVDGGLMRAKPRKSPVLIRVEQFAQDVLEVIQERQPSVIVLEVSTTCHGRANDGGHAATLGVYGLAVGYLLRTCQQSGVRTEAVEATVWTRGVSKKKRQKLVALAYQGQYKAETDPGGDLADAIGLGRWWLRRLTAGAG